MLSFSRTTGYAILALSCIAKWDGQWVLSQTIHQCTGVPMPYLRKILFALSKAGLVETKRGYRGGFVLARSPEEITFLDVVEAVEGNKLGGNCILGLPRCDNTAYCPMRGFCREQQSRMETQLARVTFADATQWANAAWAGDPSVCDNANCGPNCAAGNKLGVSPVRKRLAQGKRKPPPKGK